MATRGRKPLPTALKLLEGDRGKGRRPLNQSEPIPPKATIRCPSWLLPEAKKEWKRLAPALKRKRRLALRTVRSTPQARTLDALKVRGGRNGD